MSEFNKELLTFADMSENIIFIKEEPIESADLEEGFNCSTDEKQYQLKEEVAYNEEKTEQLDFRILENTKDANMVKREANYEELCSKDSWDVKEEEEDSLEDRRMKKDYEDIEIKEELLDFENISSSNTNCEILESSSSVVGNLKPSKKRRKEEKEESEEISDSSLQSDVKIKKKFICSVCNYGVNHMGNFKKHILIHTDVKLFYCSECSHACIRKSDLKRHLLTHTDVKLFVCSECDYSCNRKNNLEKHLLVHTNIKLFQCSECEYSCNRKDDYKRHLLMHNGVKLFQCSECVYSGNRKGDFDRHLLTHAKIKLFQCSECDYSCNRKNQLSSHKLTHNKLKDSNVQSEIIEGVVN